tara:strand:- start:651 stop:896 length:246 start_codon:yes stop_codon:yes gene_type:complete
MIKFLLVLLLSIFQDNYVRFGTILGAILGFWITNNLQIDPIKNSFIFGFIGWGFGIYIANYFKENTTKSKKKFRIIKGEKK